MPDQDRAPDARDIAAIWPCASLMMPFPIPDLGEAGAPQADAGATAAPARHACGVTLVSRLRQRFVAAPPRPAGVART
ncbi:hypothetical protein ACBY01_06595 [Sphingomonas sp. ac-8]|uniref:hypothetical protein n=1 Tax=Sphingomonas sp. ac-8 TaxID=3242977 RepID=UPI003A807715